MLTSQRAEALTIHNCGNPNWSVERFGEAEILQGDYRSSIKPQAVLGTLRAFEIRYDVLVMFFETPEQAGRQVESWAFWFTREMVEIINALWRGSGNNA